MFETVKGIGSFDALFLSRNSFVFPLLNFKKDSLSHTNAEIYFQILISFLVRFQKLIFWILYYAQVSDKSQRYFFVLAKILIQLAQCFFHKNCYIFFMPLSISKEWIGSNYLNRNLKDSIKNKELKRSKFRSGKQKKMKTISNQSQ